MGGRAQEFVLRVFEGKGSHLARSARDLNGVGLKGALRRENVSRFKEGEGRRDAAFHGAAQGEKDLVAARACLLPAFVGDTVRAGGGVARGRDHRFDDLKVDIADIRENVPF